jgi:hypothetical protein
LSLLDKIRDREKVKKRERKGLKVERKLIKKLQREDQKR